MKPENPENANTLIESNLNRVKIKLRVKIFCYVKYYQKHQNIITIIICLFTTVQVNAARKPTAIPTTAPTAIPTTAPTAIPTTPTAVPTAKPTTAPTAIPTVPTGTPVAEPTAIPTVPTGTPVAEPTATPTAPPAAFTGTIKVVQNFVFPAGATLQDLTNPASSQVLHDSILSTITCPPGDTCILEINGVAFLPP